MKSFWGRCGVAALVGVAVPGVFAVPVHGQERGLLDLGYQLVNANSGKCLTVTAGGLADNAILIQKRCTRDSSYRWRFERAGADYRIVNVRSGKCLTIAGDSAEDNGFAIQHVCGGGPAGQWQVSGRSLLTFKDVQLENAHSHKCLTIAGGSAGENGVAVQYNCDAESSRRWTAKLTVGPALD
ncbi:RICIN domain-containing protein [Paractinoplanes durhamensis]|nr:RICIN domain-containing protein [Actinoplanes durhamensis]